MLNRKRNSELVLKLRRMLSEIFLAKRQKDPVGISTEAFGEDFDLLNWSSRVNAGEELTPEQRTKVQEIWEREALGMRLK